MWQAGLALDTLNWLRRVHVMLRGYCLHYLVVNRRLLRLLLGLLVVNRSGKRSGLTFAILMLFYVGRLSVILFAMRTRNKFLLRFV